MTERHSRGLRQPSEPAIDELRQLVDEAAEAPRSERVERYRDRLARGGPPVVALLLDLEKDRPELGMFAVTALEAAAKLQVMAAHLAIRSLIKTAATAETRAFAAHAIGRLDSTFAAYVTTLDVINKARRRRGKPILDAAEMQQVVDNFAARKSDPRRYQKPCWSCHAVVDEATNERCSECRWFICWCGACRDPSYTDPATGRKDACPQEEWLLSQG